MSKRKKQRSDDADTKDLAQSPAKPYLSPPLTADPPKKQDRIQRYLYPSDKQAVCIWSNSFKLDEMWKSDGELSVLLHNLEQAIEHGVSPQRISKGSSGSYFARSTEGKTVGIYKPNDEEPYSEFNPKIIKILHRTICPCLFGRGCLMPNVGFISETAASIVDRHFGLGIVPRTEIVDLSSDSFNYGLWWTPRKKLKGKVPTKTGSFQLFISDLHDSLEAIKHLEIAQTRYPQVGLALQLEFEKLVVLDYIIRNTDRTFNNWLFAVEWREPMEDRVVSRMPLPPADLDSKAAVAIKIVGIDNGLSFPWKHPDQWRSYPYSWIDMKQAQVPFSELIRRQLLPILRDASSWDDLINTKLKPIFQLDNAFSERFFRLQMSVMRGQMRNLIIALESGYSPYKMVKELPPIRIEADDEFFERRYGSRTDRGGFELDAFFTNSERKLWKKKVQARPCFSIF